MAANLRNAAIIASFVAMACAEGQLEERWTHSTDVSEKTRMTRRHMIWAHGLMMGICFGILYPFGAAFLHMFNFRGAWLVHAVWQTFTYCVTIAAAGLGIYFARVYHDLNASNSHNIIGLVVVICLFFQPWTGLWHHILYKRTGQRTAYGAGHRWFGRIVLALGTINAGWGLKIAGKKDWIMAYSIPAGLFYLLWITVVLWDKYRRKKQVVDSEISRRSSEAESGKDESIGEEK